VALTVGTHSGTFHADDVLAFALVRVFVDPEATVVRTRDRDRLDLCDLVVDVGGSYDPARLRFDHHQGSYTGPRSSAGMVVDWLEATGRIEPSLASHLRERLVDYVDAVDTGRQAPRVEVPCLARVVEAIAEGAESPEELRLAFLEAAAISARFVEGLTGAHRRIERAREAVVRAMGEAAAAGRATIILEAYHPWKPVYFAHGGADHPTAFVMFPSEDDTWKVVAIPPSLGQFEQKRSLPLSWAGKMGDELEAATGVPGSLFCHKNRFIAVFRTRAAAEEALRRFGLWDHEVEGPGRVPRAARG
jgi:uncharacterized UPF0160 family protein